MTKPMKAIVITAALFLAGCDAFSQYHCYQAVVAKYPDGQVSGLPGEKYKFIVKDSGGRIIYVAAMGLNMEDLISEELVLFNPKKTPF